VDLDKKRRGVSLVELIASVSIAAVAVALALGGLRSLRAMAGMQRATAVVRDAVETARRLAYLGAEIASVGARRNGLSVTGTDGKETVRTFELPGGFVITHASRGGTVRFFADGLSDNASVTVAHEASGATSTLFIDSRGEIR
jgi:prepilin-type N-terminal cleavage/methylation domain-containing protein